MGGVLLILRWQAEVKKFKVNLSMGRQLAGDGVWIQTVIWITRQKHVSLTCMYFPLTVHWPSTLRISRYTISVQFSSVAVISDSLQPHESQHTRTPCPSPAPRVYSNSCPSSWWCHPAISSSVVPFSSCPQSLPASGSFSMSQLFAWGGQSIGVSASASVLPVTTQDWSPLVFFIQARGLPGGTNDEEPACQCR